MRLQAFLDHMRSCPQCKKESVPLTEQEKKAANLLAAHIELKDRANEVPREKLSSGIVIKLMLAAQDVENAVLPLDSLQHSKIAKLIYCFLEGVAKAKL